ncbi:rhodanese-like domain-containing protein [Mucilaginibacter segetis]|uniref:Rhodanese-like domain-containing protein n=1 Tax=Mucilaginibacter segetis TaxID=2793071 RepID=A0A934PVU9_9SPHI|nr:rhodanese-like domain-containing protein [Mucilaginibacter segetis]MBK0380476.1 rhodanese-like domain-containing protein [Mucilaginibacter segetis]
MKKIYICGLFLLLAGFSANAQTSPKEMTITPGPGNPWASGELIQPDALVAQINSASAKTPPIFNIGAVEDIKGATHIGAVGNTENLLKFKKALADLPKGTEVVIYCGCCPFAKCPNIRPAYNELKTMGFTHIKLLNLPNNLQTNWIAKGYPLAK